MARLTNQESRGFTHVLKFTAADLNRSGFLTSSEKLIVKLPAGGVITNAALFENVAFAGTSTDISFSVGTITGTATNLIAATDIDKSAGTFVTVAFNTGSAVDTEPGLINNTTGAVDVFLRATGTISAAGVSAGEWLVGLTILDPQVLASNA